jgi:hypothetical protein
MAYAPPTRKVLKSSARPDHSSNQQLPRFPFQPEIQGANTRQAQSLTPASRSDLRATPSSAHCPMLSGTSPCLVSFHEYNFSVIKFSEKPRVHQPGWHCRSIFERLTLLLSPYPSWIVANDLQKRNVLDRYRGLIQVCSDRPGRRSVKLLSVTIVTIGPIRYGHCNLERTNSESTLACIFVMQRGRKPFQKIRGTGSSSFVERTDRWNLCSAS